MALTFLLLSLKLHFKCASPFYHLFSECVSPFCYFSCKIGKVKVVLRKWSHLKSENMRQKIKDIVCGSVVAIAMYPQWTQFNVLEHIHALSEWPMWTGPTSSVDQLVKPGSPPFIQSGAQHSVITGVPPVSTYCLNFVTIDPLCKVLTLHMFMYISYHLTNPSIQTGPIVPFGWKITNI